DTTPLKHAASTWITLPRTRLSCRLMVLVGRLLWSKLACTGLASGSPPCCSNIKSRPRVLLSWQRLTALVCLVCHSTTSAMSL
ncbi:hypothetical protein GGF44_006546, partial [Coemansia sp. RSA 1694]